MKKIELMDKYPVFVYELPKSDTDKKSVEEILKFLKEKIDQHPVAVFIGYFDHYAHTKNLPEGKIDEKILDAKNIIFCFGKELPKPEVVGVRPRSIGVVETAQSFIFSFLEAPNPQANQAMQTWIKEV